MKGCVQLNDVYDLKDFVLQRPTDAGQEGRVCVGGGGGWKTLLYDI